MDLLTARCQLRRLRSWIWLIIVMAAIVAGCTREGEQDSLEPEIEVAADVGATIVGSPDLVQAPADSLSTASTLDLSALSIAAADPTSSTTSPTITTSTSTTSTIGPSSTNTSSPTTTAKTTTEATVATTATTAAQTTTASSAAPTTGATTTAAPTTTPTSAPTTLATTTTTTRNTTTTTTTAQPPAGGDLDQAEAASLALLNQLRASLGLGALAASDQEMSSFARSWSAEMSRTGFRHSSAGWAENIVWHSSNRMTPQEAAARFHDMWVNSPGHYRNMTNPNWTVAGVGLYRDAGGWWGTHVFR